MTVSNSIILTEWRDSSCGGDRTRKDLGNSGCSEYVALNNTVYSFVSLPFYMLNPDSLDSFDKLKKIHPEIKGEVTYISEWVKFVYNALKSINQDEELISLYTWGEFVADKFVNNVGSGNGISHTKKSFTYNSRTASISDDEVIGIKTHVNRIRKKYDFTHFDDNMCQVRGKTSNADRCRKVQLAHTALRYGWNCQYQMVPLCLHMQKVIPNVDPFYILQMAWQISGRILGNWNADYGSLFNSNGELIQQESFLTAFNNPEVNGVTNHFNVSMDPLIKMMHTTANQDLGSVLKWSKEKTILKLMGEGSIDLYSTIEMFIKSLSVNDDLDPLKVKFKFVNTIFSSTVKNAVYNGFKKKGNNIDRILFKDEEGGILSVAQSSKLIEII